MRRRFLYAVLGICLSCGSFASLASRAQSPVADGQRDYNSGRYNRVVDAMTSAAAKTPNDAPLHFLLGQSYYQLREFQRAIASLERAVALSPKESEYHDWLGKSYGRKAEESVFLGAMSWARKTHKEFEIAVQLNPSNFEAQRDLIRYLTYLAGRGREATSLDRTEVLRSGTGGLVPSSAGRQSRIPPGDAASPRSDAEPLHQASGSD